MAVNEVAQVSVGGEEMAIHTARPDGDGKSPAVIVIQEIFGVNGDIKSIADRFASEGYFAAAPELFHRSGAGVDIPFSEMERAFGERGKLSNDDIRADVQATLDYLKGNPNVDADNIGIVGVLLRRHGVVPRERRWRGISAGGRVLRRRESCRGRTLRRARPACSTRRQTRCRLP